MKGRKIYLLAISIVVLFMLVWLLITQSKRTDNSSEANAQTFKVTRRDIGYSVQATGIIKPKVGADVRVGSRVSGLVQHLYANIGDKVQKGDILAELDPTELQAEYDQAKAALDNARANFEYAKVDLKRQQSLLQQNFISRNQVDLAEKTFEITKAQVEQADANLAYADIQLGYTKIKAPISGVIASVSTQEGETVAARFSAPTFVTIIDLNRIEVWAYVDETDIGRIKVGQRAEFTVDTYSDIDFEGEVTAIYPKAFIQDNVVNYVATTKITDNKGKELRPEMTTFVTIHLEERKNVLAIPTSAIRREKGDRIVYVNNKGTIISRPVKVGWNNNGFTEIILGLSEGEEVLLSEPQKER